MRTAKLVNTYRATVRDINTLLDTVCVSVARNDLHYSGGQICMTPLGSLAFGVLCNACSVTWTWNKDRIYDGFLVLSLD